MVSKCISLCPGFMTVNCIVELPFCIRSPLQFLKQKATFFPEERLFQVLFHEFFLKQS